MACILKSICGVMCGLYHPLVLPTRLELDFPTNVILGDNYIGTCRATGNPRPILNLISGHCPQSVHYTSPNTYTAQAVITMQVMMECKTIYCSTTTNYNPLIKIISLNITGKYISCILSWCYLWYTTL